MKQVCWRIAGADSAALHVRDDEMSPWIIYSAHRSHIADHPHTSPGFAAFIALRKLGYENVKYEPESRNYVIV